MHPEDRVLVAVITRPEDFEAARDSGWYRVPEEKAPRGVFFEYIAFYFTAAFGEKAYTVHYYARRLGHELVTRSDLLSDEPDHPRAEELYYKLQSGPLQKRVPVLAEYCHPFEKSDARHRPVAKSLPATPTRKAGHEFFTVFPRAAEHRLSLPGSQTAYSPVDEA